MDGPKKSVSDPLENGFGGGNAEREMMGGQENLQSRIQEETISEEQENITKSDSKQEDEDKLFGERTQEETISEEKENITKSDSKQEDEDKLSGEQDTLMEPDIKEEKRGTGSGGKETLTNGEEKNGKRSGESLLGGEKKRLKTDLCVHFQKKLCRYGDACRFAHSAEKLKQSGTENGQETENPVIPKKWPSEEELVAQYGRLNKCIINLPKQWETAEFTGFIDSFNMKYQSIKKQKGAIIGFLTFQSEADANAAVSVLSKQALRGQDLRISEARPRPFEIKAMVRSGGVAKPANGHPQNGSSEGDKMQVEKQRDDSVQGEETENGARKIETGAYDEDLRKDIRDAVTPWWKVDYSEQLKRKEAVIGQLLKKLARKARKSLPHKTPLPNWIRNSKKHNGMACPLLGIVASPVTEGYRNKCEFTMGLGMDGQRMVGFQLGLYREGYTAIASPKDCQNVSPTSKAYVEIIQDFIRTSELSVWDKKDNKGVWRMVTVREGRAAQATDSGSAPIEEVLLMVQVSAQSASSNEALQSEYQRLKETIVSRAAEHSPPLPLTYLVVQVHEGVSNAAPPGSTQIVLADNRAKQEGSEESTEAAHIFEQMCGLRFRLSLSAFFQVNTSAAEKLYRLAGDWAGLNSRSLLFDVCCGTGTIGITLASTVGKVVGIDMIEPAIEDAKKIAQLNGIENCEFVCGRAEAVLGRLLAQYASEVAPADVAASGTANGAEMADVATPGAVNGAQSDDVTAAEGTGDVAAAEPSIAGSQPSGDDAPDMTEAKSIAANSETSEANEKIVAVNTASISSEAKATSKAGSVKDGGGPLYSDVVAIVDPPRCGLHPTVLKALAAHERLRRLVYISCNPESLITNVLELCVSSSGGYQGKGGARAPPPFRPVKAMAVDLFPHTPHCEMVMLLER